MPLNEQTATEIQDLAWAMADETISADDAKRLEDLLLADPEARQLYVQCMQLQADLHLFFNPKPVVAPNIPVEAPPATPVMTSLPGSAPIKGSAKVG
jgi:hypothetical protein